MNEMKMIPPRRRFSDLWIVWTAILAVILVVICVVGLVIVKQSILAGVDSAYNEFTDAYNDTKSATSELFKNKAYEIAEKLNHVSNDVTISISDVKEKSNLEVLKVSDIVYIIDETESGTSSWLKVTGTGVFTVNLTAAEYLIDNGRSYVLVRVPAPVLDAKNISIDEFESLHYEENKWNPSNSIRSGEELARNQLNEAKGQIQEDFESSENYSKLASASAESMIRSIIQGLNSDIPNVEVDVEFY